LSAWIRALVLATVVAAPAVARAQQAVNPMHPVFAPLDAQGQATTSAAQISAGATCGACHDAAYIGAHSGHAQATCIQCHVDGGRLDVSPERLDPAGRLVRSALRIGTPRPGNCATCHGVVSDGGPVLLPLAFGDTRSAPGRNWALTLGEGAIVAPQRMADSFLDLEGKSGLATPWDVHAAKLVECTSCHYAANNPARTDDKRQSLRYVTADPRRQSTAEFLQRPDHRFVEPGCRSCHDGLAAHDFLPYRERHLEVVACQTCHISSPMGPTAEMIDETVATLEGGPVVRFRNVDRRPGESLNAAFIRPFRPLLVERVEPDGARRLAPVNVVSRFRWVAAATGEAVPAAQIARAFLDEGRYAPAILSALDRNGDGRLDEAELRLDTQAKVDLVAARLAALGVRSPVIDGALHAHPLAHGVTARSHALRACDECHAAGSRLSQDFPIAPYLPGGVSPRPPEGGRVALSGKITPTAEGGLVFQRERGASTPGLHVLGATRHAWSNRLGSLLFLAVALGVSIHGAVRLLMKRKHPHAHPAPASGGERVYVFGWYERIWHWTMAASGIVLIVTGLDIHNAGASWLPSLPRSVALHNVAAVVLTVNAFLSLFYHLATVAIRSFIPDPQGFMKRVLEHVSYQSRGIFHGASHPVQGAEEKLNPLQQITYLGLLNLLFPLQIATGALLWGIGRWPSVGAAVGGLSVVAPVHNFGAWLFLSFFVLHVYLVTTGRTVGDHLQSMVTGYRTIEPEEQTP
jgi:thiosulfate reductase cytochrome b subunit